MPEISTTPEVMFEERAEEAKQRCSEHVCKDGHVWVPTIKVGTCGGCGGPVLAVKMENCPVCNEPSVYTRIRIDHIGYKQPLHAICRGVATNAEVVMAEMKRGHWTEAEQVKGLPQGTEPAKRWNMTELEGRLQSELKKAVGGGADLQGVEIQVERAGVADSAGCVDGCGGTPGRESGGGGDAEADGPGICAG